MITNIFFSKNETLIFALEDIKNQLDIKFKDFDFLFFSFHPQYDYNEIGYFINKIFKTDKWAGFYSLDSFANDEIIKGIVLLAIKFENQGKISVFQIEDIKKKNALLKTADYLNKNKSSLHIIVSGLCNNQIAFFIENLNQHINYTPINNIIGGIASGNMQNNTYLTYIFLPNKVIKNGFVIISFFNVEFEIGIALGFKPYGVTYEIKKAEGYKLFCVDDGKNAALIYKNLLKGINNFKIEYLWFCPINILDENEGYVATLRTPKEIGEDYIEFFGPVKRGEKFKISFAEDEELLEEDKKIALKIKQSLTYPDLLMNFSCVARQYVLNNKKHCENKIYIKTLNNHLFGFFTFGEIGPDKFFKSLKFYNETSLLVALKEL